MLLGVFLCVLVCLCVNVCVFICVFACQCRCPVKRGVGRRMLSPEILSSVAVGQLLSSPAKNANSSNTLVWHTN